MVITIAALAFGSLVAHKSHLWYNYSIVSLCCCVSLSWSPSIYPAQGKWSANIVYLKFQLDQTPIVSRKTQKDGTNCNVIWTTYQLKSGL